MFYSGARGLGYCMSEALCEVGCKAIAIMDVLQEHGDSAALELNKKYNIPAAFYKVDVRDAEAVKEVMTSVLNLSRSCRPSDLFHAGCILLTIMFRNRLLPILGAWTSFSALLVSPSKQYISSPSSLQG